MFELAAQDNMIGLGLGLSGFTKEIDILPLSCPTDLWSNEVVGLVVLLLGVLDDDAQLCSCTRYC